MYKIAICDEYQNDREKYKKLIEEISEKYKMNVKINFYEQGSKLLNSMLEPSNIPDIIYIDINMSKEDGIQIVKSLVEKDYLGEVIFLTESKEYFLEGFDLHIFNYFVKSSCKLERFEKMLIDAINRSSQNKEDILVLTSCGESIVVPVNKITYFECYRRIITVYYEEKTFEFYSSMGKMEEDLFGKDFIRIHRSYIVALGRIKRFTAKEVEMLNGEKLPIGRKYYSNLKEKLEQ